QSLALPDRLCAGCSRCRSLRCEERLHKIICGEFDEIVHLLSDSDKTYWDLQILRDRCDNAAFRGSVQLCQDESSNARRLGELPSLRQPVLSSGCIEHEQ